MNEFMSYVQWYSRDQNLKVNASTLEAKAIGLEAKAFKFTARAEMITLSTSQPNKIGNELNFDCFCLDIHYY